MLPITQTEIDKLTKQSVLDMNTTEPVFQVLQMLLYTLSKTKIEQLRRVFNELNSTILYKTQYRELTFSQMLQLLNIAVSLNQQTSENDH